MPVRPCSTAKGPFRREPTMNIAGGSAPGDMVTEFLRRDLRHAGLFRAVLSARDTEETRFVLEGRGGGISRSGRREKPEGASGRDGDTSGSLPREVRRRVVFQKTYRCEAPFYAGGGGRTCRSDEPGDVAVLDACHCRYRSSPAKGRSQIKTTHSAGLQRVNRTI